MISLGSPHVHPMGVHRTCGEPNGIELAPIWGGVERLVRRTRAAGAVAFGLQREPFNFTPMAVNVGRTCGEPDEIKKNAHPKNITPFFS